MNDLVVPRHAKFAIQSVLKTLPATKHLTWLTQQVEREDMGEAMEKVTATGYVGEETLQFVDSRVIPFVTEVTNMWVSETDSLAEELDTDSRKVYEHQLLFGQLVAIALQTKVSDEWSVTYLEEAPILCFIHEPSAVCLAYTCIFPVSHWSIHADLTWGYRKVDGPNLPWDLPTWWTSWAAENEARINTYVKWIQRHAPGVQGLKVERDGQILRIGSWTYGTLGGIAFQDPPACQVDVFNAVLPILRSYGAMQVAGDTTLMWSTLRSTPHPDDNHTWTLDTVQKGTWVPVYLAGWALKPLGKMPPVVQQAIQVCLHTVLFATPHRDVVPGINNLDADTWQSSGQHWDKYMAHMASAILVLQQRTWQAEPPLSNVEVHSAPYGLRISATVGNEQVPVSVTIEWKQPLPPTLLQPLVQWLYQLHHLLQRGHAEWLKRMVQIIQTISEQPPSGVLFDWSRVCESTNGEMLVLPTYDHIGTLSTCMWNVFDGTCTLLSSYEREDMTEIISWIQEKFTLAQLDVFSNIGGGQDKSVASHPYVRAQQHETHIQLYHTMTKGSLCLPDHS